MKRTHNKGDGKKMNQTKHESVYALLCSVQKRTLAWGEQACWANLILPGLSSSGTHRLVLRRTVGRRCTGYRRRGPCPWTSSTWSHPGGKYCSGKSAFCKTHAPLVFARRWNQCSRISRRHWHDSANVD